jgi:hypothetical protein
METIRYIDETHQYFDIATDVELISVTTRLKDEGFYDFLDRIPDIKYYQELGTAYHNAIALYLTGNLKKVSPQLEGYVDGARAYLKSVEAEILAVEETLGYLSMKTAGRPDLIIRSRGVVTIPDWKRSFCKPYALQLAGYRVLHNISRLEDNPVVNIEAVMLDGKGGFKLADRKHYPSNLDNMFISMVNWQNSKGRFV